MIAEALRAEGCCDAAPVAVREMFREHLRKVAKAMRAIEWNDSCDGASDEQDLILACLNGGESVAALDRVLASAEEALRGLRTARSELSKGGKGERVLSGF